MRTDFERELQKKKLILAMLFFAFALLLSWVSVSIAVWLFCWMFNIPFLLVYSFRAWIIYVVWAVFFKRKKEK